jgi:hypothetical protein
VGSAFCPCWPPPPRPRPPPPPPPPPCVGGVSGFSVGRAGGAVSRVGCGVGAAGGGVVCLEHATARTRAVAAPIERIRIKTRDDEDKRWMARTQWQIWGLAGVMTPQSGKQLGDCQGSGCGFGREFGNGFREQIRERETGAGAGTGTDSGAGNGSGNGNGFGKCEADWLRVRIDPIRE